MKQNTKSKKMTMGLLLVYLIVLTWIIVFKMEFDISLLQCTHFRSINLIPFGASLVVNGHIDASEILLNVIAFIPFGIYLSIVKNEWNFFQKVLPIFLVSLSYEIVQYIFAIGGSDITDLIGNTLGGIIGIGLFVVIEKILGKNTVKIINVLATIGTVFIVIFLSLLAIANM